MHKSADKGGDAWDYPNKNNQRVEIFKTKNA